MTGIWKWILSWFKIMFDCEKCQDIDIEDLRSQYNRDVFVYTMKHKCCRCGEVCKQFIKISKYGLNSRWMFAKNDEENEHCILGYCCMAEVLGPYVPIDN